MNTMKLAERIKQREFTSVQQEALLSIIVTGSWILGELASAMSKFGVTPAQYNCLRILRGAAPEKLTCGEIGARLLDRTPDVTRMITRLMKAGLVDRERAEHDRRVVEVWVTPKGIELLKEMDPMVDAIQIELMKSLSDDELRELTGLLERLRTS